MTTATKNRIVKKNKTGSEDGNGKPVAERRRVEIAAPNKEVMEIELVGDRPLMTNNKYAVAQRIHDVYGGVGGSRRAADSHVSRQPGWSRWPAGGGRCV